MKNIEILYNFGFNEIPDIKFNDKLEFTEFKRIIKKITDPYHRAQFCQQAIQKTFYVYHEVSSYLNDVEFHIGLIDYDKPYFQYSMKMQSKIGDLCSRLIDFFKSEIESDLNYFTQEMRELLLNSLNVYKIIFYGEKIDDTKKSKLKLLVVTSIDGSEDHTEN